VAGIDKRALRDQLYESLLRERDQLVAAQRATQAGLVHEDNRAEGDKDMRSTEASYLARGQAQRVEAIERDVQRIRVLELKAFSDEDKIVSSALVTIESDQETKVLFLVPAGGGARLELEGLTVQVVTPSSPLGRALLGSVVGAEVRVDAGGRVLEYEVTGVE